MIPSNHRLVMGMSTARPVSDNLHTSNHLSDGEEANDFGSNDTSSGKFFARDIPDPRQNGLRRKSTGSGGGLVVESSRVSSGVD